MTTLKKKGVGAQFILGYIYGTILRVNEGKLTPEGALDIIKAILSTETESTTKKAGKK